MAEQLQKFFVGKEDEEKRYRYLHKQLGLDGGDTHYTFGLFGDLGEVLEDYNTFKKWGRYPFGDGGKYIQPVWVIENFRTLDMLAEYFELDKKFGVKKVNDSVPRADQWFKDPVKSLKQIEGGG